MPIHLCDCAFACVCVCGCGCGCGCLCLCCICVQVSLVLFVCVCVCVCFCWCAHDKLLHPTCLNVYPITHTHTHSHTHTYTKYTHAYMQRIHTDMDSEGTGYVFQTEFIDVLFRREQGYIMSETHLGAREFTECGQVICVCVCCVCVCMCVLCVYVPRLTRFNPYLYRTPSTR
jgi:hypothetical protein